MPTYYALIKNKPENSDASCVDKHWLWEGESPRYSDEKTPIFKNGDQLFLRILGCHGTHTIALQLPEVSGDNGPPPMPFEAPNNKLSFEYDAAHPLFIVAPLIGQRSPWRFTIKHPDGGSIDPEFQVGTGNDNP